MRDLAPLCLAIPILGAALLAAIGRFIPHLLSDLIATASVLAVNALTLILVARTGSGRVVTWAGGWTPHHGVSVGIVLVVDRAGAGMAALASLMTLAALVFAWRYLGGSEPLAHALLLVFVTGMCGLAMTGDLFDMFVFFELMSVAAYALTAWKSEEPQSEQGGYTFGMVNSVGAYVTLAGIGVLYARTGELGLAAIGSQLRRGAPAPFVAAAFALVATGFLVKAAVAPFHFWIADAHAVAPTPVCVLFSGVMVELGLYSLLRLYFTCFAGVLPAAGMRHLLLTIGTVTALVGSLMSLLQPSVKRMLAFSTMAHMGLMFVGVAVLDSDAVAGAAEYLLSHSAAKAALFICAGILLNRHGSVDQRRLHGQGRGMPVTATLFLLGGLALADLPPFGTAAGKGIMEDAATKAGHGWVWGLFIVVAACTGAAVLAAWARVFRGWGSPAPVEEGEQTQIASEEPDTDAELTHVPVTMALPAAALLAGAVALGVVPGVGHTLASVADQLRDSAGYAAATLGQHSVTAAAKPVHLWTGAGVAADVASVVLALGLATFSVLRPQRQWLHSAARLLEPLRRVHSGHIGDYVAWLTVGVTVTFTLLRTG